MTITRVDLLRHGVCNDGQIYRGRTDSILSSQGEQQMAAAVQNLQWQAVISSPLQRCLSFSQDLAKRNNTPLEVDPRLEEFNFGDWEGRALDEVWSADQERVLAFWNDPVNCPPPNGESLAVMQDRVIRVLDSIHRQYRGQHVLLVTHGGVIRLLIGYLLQTPMRAVRQLSIDYGSLSRIEIYPEVDTDDYASEVIFTNRLINMSEYEVYAADD